MSSGPHRLQRGERGVTLIEMLVVVAILGIVSALTYPSITAGLDSLQLNTAADNVGSTVIAAANHARRKQDWVEIRVHPQQLEILGTGLARTVDLKQITAAPEQSIFIDPLGTIPAATVDLSAGGGASLRVRLDPITGNAEVQDVPRNPETDQR